MKKSLVVAVFLALAIPVMAADEDTNLGDSIVGELASDYLDIDDKESADTYIDFFIEGWVDGFRSIYIYEGVISTDEQQAELFECTSESSYADLRKGLIRVGMTQGMEEMSVSDVLYLLIRSYCEDVLGPMSDEDENQRS